MSELNDLLAHAELLRAGGERFAVATVVRLEGSMYRQLGTRMLITESGSAHGAISAGCLEGAIIGHARWALAHGEPSVVRFDTSTEEDLLWGTGLGCAGIVDVLIEDGSSGSGADALKQLARFHRTRRGAVIATVFDVPERAAVRMCDRLYLDYEGWEQSSIVDLQSRAALRGTAEVSLSEGATRSSLVKVPSGAISALVEVVRPTIRLIAIGEGPDVRPLVRAGRFLGWECEVVMQKAAAHRAARFEQAGASVFVSEDYSLVGLEFDARTAAVVMTHKYVSDRRILGQLVSSRAGYIGLLGPRQRSMDLWRDLQGEKQLEERVFSPVGLNIGSDTPVEIALSIVAEIMAVMNGRAGGSLRLHPGPIHDR